jgi:hypothetical protein
MVTLHFIPARLRDNQNDLNIIPIFDELGNETAAFLGKGRVRTNRVQTLTSALPHGLLGLGTKRGGAKVRDTVPSIPPTPPIPVYACGAPAASRCLSVFVLVWKPGRGWRREGSLQTAPLFSRAMPGPPTSGSAGCAITRPYGLHTGLDEERAGIGPPSGLQRSRARQERRRPPARPSARTGRRVFPGRIASSEPAAAP